MRERTYMRNRSTKSQENSRETLTSPARQPTLPPEGKIFWYTSALDSSHAKERKLETVMEHVQRLRSDGAMKGKKHSQSPRSCASGLPVSRITSTLSFAAS